MEPIRLETFMSILKMDIKDIQKRERFGKPSNALAFWYGSRILNLNDRDSKTACRFQGRGERGIDFFYVDTSKRKIIIVQAEATEDFDPKKTFGSSSIRKLRSALSALANPDKIQEGDPILTAAEDYGEYHNRKKFQVELIAIISGVPGNEMKKDYRSFLGDLKKNYPNHTLEILYGGKLNEEYCKAIERALPPDILLHIHPIIMRYTDDTVVVSIPGSEINRIVKEEKFSLFEKNARLPLLKSGVNREIEKQLKNSARREKFWYLNNGLTIVCKSFNLNKAKHEINLSEAQIVNGCQTAWTLHKHPKSLEKVYVLAKIIKTEDSEFAYSIRRATNFQNAITARDLRSGDFIQLRLQTEFERLGYYYERKRDEWKVWKKSLPDIVIRFPQKNIDNEKLARCFLAFEGKPSEAKEKTREIFES